MTEALTWKPYYRPIVDGTNVQASVTNSPLSDLFNNQLYLKNQLDSMLPGQALVISDQTLLSTVVVGTPVYLASTGVWSPAIAELDSSPNSSLFTLTSKAYVAGIVISRNAYGRGSIALQGQVTLGAEFASVLEGTYAPGIQYLSPYTAGKITASKGVAPVRVCMVYGPAADGTYRIIVNPDQRAQLESHGHYHFELTDAPAGDANVVPAREDFMWGELEPDGPFPGVTHHVVDPDPSVSGWLPATSTYFPDREIPAGAYFGYNIAVDTALRAVWPPLPVENVSVEVDGINEVGDRVEVNSDGIWWMANTYGKAPWPVNLPVEGIGATSSSNNGYPIWPVRIDLWFSKTLHGTTVEALNNQVELMVAEQPGLIPVAVGSNIEQVMLTSRVTAYQLLSTAGQWETSSIPGVAVNSLLYTLDSRAFTVIGTRTPQLALEVVLGVNNGNTTSIALLQSALALKVTRIPAPLSTGLKAYSDIVTESPGWATAPAGATVPNDQYFTFKSTPIVLAPHETYTLELEWSGNLQVSATDKVFVISVRPIVTL